MQSVRAIIHTDRSHRSPVRFGAADQAAADCTADCHDNQYARDVAPNVHADLDPHVGVRVRACVRARAIHNGRITRVTNTLRDAGALALARDAQSQQHCRPPRRQAKKKINKNPSLAAAVQFMDISCRIAWLA